MDIPEQVGLIIEKLEEGGHEAFAVGGCVRDALIGRIPEDWDITTSASPEQVKEIFRRTVDTGIQHGTVTVMFGKVGYEVTTYRVDGVYEDHRHPKEVMFTKNLIEDLKRRDFTINAMAYNPKQGVIDVFCGKEDLDKRRICAVGNARERFSEDALRMLRAIRFAGQLSFSIEGDTKAGIYELANTIRHVSAERIRVELTKLLVSDGSDCLKLIKELGLGTFFLPEWKGSEHSLSEVKEVNYLCKESGIEKKEQITMGFAALLHEDVKAEQAKGICRRLTFDNDTSKMVVQLIYFYKKDFTSKKMDDIEMRFLMHEIGLEVLPLLFLLQEADILAKCGGGENAVENLSLKQLRGARQQFESIRARREPIAIKDLEVDGKDLQGAGISSGPEMGWILQSLLEQVLRNPKMNDKETLIQLALQKVAESREGEKECH